MVVLFFINYKKKKKNLNMIIGNKVTLLTLDFVCLMLQIISVNFDNVGPNSHVAISCCHMF